MAYTCLHDKTTGKVWGVYLAISTFMHLILRTQYMYILSARKYLSQFVGIPFDNFWPPKHSEIPAKPTYPVGTIDRYTQKPAIHGKMSVLSMCPNLGGRVGPLRVAPQAVHSVNDQRVAPNSMIQDQSRFTRLNFARSYGILGSRLDSLPLRATPAYHHVPRAVHRCLLPVNLERKNKLQIPQNLPVTRNPFLVGGESQTSPTISQNLPVTRNPFLVGGESAMTRPGRMSEPCSAPE